MNTECLICGGQFKLFGNVGYYRIFKCRDCGFGKTEGTKIQTSRYHRDDTYIQEEELFANIFRKRVKLIERFKKSGRVLEVGCATGLMLSMFKKDGFDVLGIELSPATAIRAKKRGLEIINQPFEKVSLNQKFEVIIFNHTLEHLADPIKSIQKAAKMLNDGGLIYIDLPNFGSFMANWQKTNWPLLLPDEHPWHFSYQALDRLFQTVDMRIIHSVRASGIWDFDNPWQELWLSFKGFKKRFFKNIITAMPSWLVTKLEIGSGLIVIAQKQ